VPEAERRRRNKEEQRKGKGGLCRRQNARGGIRRAREGKEGFMPEAEEGQEHYIK